MSSTTDSTLSPTNYEELNAAVRKGDLARVQSFHKAGWDIHNTRGFVPEYPLRTAANKGHFEIVKYLVENGADVHAHNNAAICNAALQEFPEIVKYLAEHGADIHVNNNFCLYSAVSNGDVDLVKYLHQRGADIRRGDGEFLPIAALVQQRFDVLKYLLEHLELSSFDIFRITCQVVSFGNFEFLKYLKRKYDSLFSYEFHDLLRLSYSHNQNPEVTNYIFSFYLPPPARLRVEQLQTVIEKETMVAWTMKFLQYRLGVYIPDHIILQIIPYFSPLAAGVFKRKSKLFDKVFLK